MGMSFRTVAVDPDEMGWFTLVEEAEKSGFKRDVDGIFFMNPGEGLKRVFDDRDVQIICTVAGVHRVVECYIVPEIDVGQLMVWIDDGGSGSLVTKSSKLLPRRKNDVKSGSVVTFEKGGSPESSLSFITPKDGISPTLKSPKPAAKINLKTSFKSPQKCSNTSSVVIRTSPRFSSNNIIPKKSTENTNVEDLPPPNTDKLVTVGTSFDFNDLRIADLFNEYEERADEASLNCVEGYCNFSEGEEEDPIYDPEGDAEDIDVEDDDSVTESEQEDKGIDDLIDGGDEDDYELQEARLKQKAWNANALKIAHQLELEAAAGKLTGQDSLNIPSTSKVFNVNLSDYDDSGDEEDTPGESDEEGVPGKRKRSSVPIVDEKSDFSKLKWCVGIRFPNPELFKEAVTRYAVAQGRDLTFDISDKARGRKLRVRCKQGCPFKLYGSWDNKLACFLVKTVDHQHTCHRTMNSNRQLKSTWVAKQFLEVFKAKPHWPAKDIIETVRRAYKVLIKKSFAYKVKYYAHKLLHGSMKEHYSRIGSYIAALQQGNPTSVFTMYTNPNVRSNPATFQRFFICFDALKQGWQLGCRKVLCVDACFLKTFLGGQLISAIGRDGNEQMFPLAWAVVEGENNESYEWFFQQLKTSLGEIDGDGWTIISDQHQSILAMVAKEFPKAEHRQCARHIFANWHKTYKGDEMKLMFWNCAKAYNEADFNEALEALREVDHKAAEAFIACRPTLFCRAFIQTHTKNDVIVNNMAETFNAYIVDARSKHVIYMLEEIRSLLMQRIMEKKTEMEASSDVVCPRVQVRLEEEKHKAAACFVLPSKPTLFQVTYGIDNLSVDLEARTCTCRKWDLTGIPCFHAVAAIFEKHGYAEDYVHDMYKREAYLQSYNLSISPCPGQRHWPKVDLPINPPPIKVGPGRPRRKRRRDPFENPKKPGKLTKHGIEMSCSVCKSKSHNKRKCPEKDNQPPPPPKRPMGRPRKSARVEVNEVQQTAYEGHHEATAQPTRIGRGGRVIRTGRGSGRGEVRGGRAGRGGRGGRTGRGGRAPQGIGVLIDEQGNAYTNVVGSTTGPRSIMEGESTQQSVNQ
ncbi:hypothetical protein KSS87_007755 [Heliosperma pusillum]|nr:hypothetical protein KSS87_007755 [Heliosperma pusillum]